MQINIKNQKIILDVDTGVDDALAILLLLKLIPDQMLGICTCGGNVTVNETTKNTLSVLSLQGRLIPVYKGSNKDLNGNDFKFARDFHGENGLCGLNYQTNQLIEDQSAVDFIIDSANKFAGELTLFLVAPLTNLALALKKDPSIALKIKQIVIMGGAVNVKGNATPFAEFNFYQDPDAVKIVLDNVKDIYIVPLDVTGKCLIKKENLLEINSMSRVGSFALDLVKSWYEVFGDPRNRFFELYDPLAVSSALGDFLSFKEEKIDLETKGEKKGGLISGESYKVNYASEVDQSKFMKFFYDTINSYKDKMIIFDMDGTLYKFKGGSYEKSLLKPKVTANVLKFIRFKLNKNQLEAEEILKQIKSKYGDQISIGLEKEYGIDRYEFFNIVWDIPAKGVVEYTPGLKETIIDLAQRYKLIIVSSAPRVWINNVLNELGVRDLFGSDIFSGEGNTRKEFGNIFSKIINDLGYKTEDCISIGDQALTDIIPAKEIGVRTIFVNEFLDCKQADIEIESINSVGSAISKIEDKYWTK